MTRINPDPIPAIGAALRAWFLLPSNVATLNGAVRVAEEDVPTDWNLRSDPPLLVVYDDGGPVQWPIKRDPTIRLTSRARGKPLAKLVVALAEGYLREHIPAGMAHIRRTGSGYLVGTDSATGADFASVTLPAVVLTTETV